MSKRSVTLSLTGELVGPRRRERRRLARGGPLDVRTRRRRQVAVVTDVYSFWRDLRMPAAFGRYEHGAVGIARAGASV